MAVATGTSMSAKHILPYIPGLKSIKSSWYRDNLSPAAKRKLEAHELYKTGKLTMKEIGSAFGVNKSTISRWISQSKEMEKLRRYNLLEPKSKAPHNTPREKVLTAEDKELILDVRRRKKCGKDNISRYILRDHGQYISPITIHRFLTKLPVSKDPLYIYRTKKKVSCKRRRKPVDRLKDVVNDLEHRAFERFQVDTKYWTVNGRQFYIVAGIDVVTRMAFARAYSIHTSRCAADFLTRLSKVFDIQDSEAYLQRDNGSEFKGDFEKAADEYGIKIITNPPRSPQSNGFIERFNRTYKEQMLIYELPETVKELNDLLYEYLIEYNFNRIHSGVNHITPFERFCELEFKKPIEILKISHEPLLQMLWTSTNSCPIIYMYVNMLPSKSKV